MAFKEDFKQLLKPYYLINTFLSVSFVVAKCVWPLCWYVFPPSESQCELNMVILYLTMAMNKSWLFIFIILYENVLALLICLLYVLVLQRESEILFFLLFVVVIRARKTGSVTMLMYLSSGYTYCKVANLILWFHTDPRYGLTFLVLFVCKFSGETTRNPATFSYLTFVLQKHSAGDDGT